MTEIPQRQFKKGQKIFWRWKRTKGMGYSEYTQDTIEEVKGHLITFNNEYAYSRAWLDINEMDII